MPIGGLLALSRQIDSRRIVVVRSANRTLGFAERTTIMLLTTRKERPKRKPATGNVGPFGLRSPSLA